MIEEFKEFINRGNVVDMAVGVIMGGAFGSIVTSLVEDIIMPLVSILTGGISFNNLFVSLDGNTYATLSQAQEAGASVIAYGRFLQSALDFIVIAAAIFLMIRTLNKFKRQRASDQEGPTTKACPYCKSMIDIEASRCPQCTSKLDD